MMIPHRVVRGNPCTGATLCSDEELSIELLQQVVRPDREKVWQVCAFLLGGGTPPPGVDRFCPYSSKWSCASLSSTIPN